MPKQMVMPISVFKYGGRDFTNGGASGKVDCIYIRHHEGFLEESKVDPALVFVEQHRGGDYWALVPAIQPKGKIGPMDGGNLASCSDSRIKHIYHIHDRFETQEEYNFLST